MSVQSMNYVTFKLHNKNVSSYISNFFVSVLKTVVRIVRSFVVFGWCSYGFNKFSRLILIFIHLLVQWFKFHSRYHQVRYLHNFYDRSV